MKIQYCSDLHLEFEHNRKYLLKKPLTISGEILILAGDIVPLHDEHFKNSFFNFIADNYKQVYWVPGNHEFYYKDLSEYSSSFNIELRSNIHIVHNTEVEIDNIQFIFSTLWSSINPANAKFIEQSVSDFFCITNNNKKIKATDFNQLHIESLHFIEQSLKNRKDKTIVVTHHLPSNLCNSKAHATSIINEAFCVDLTKYIENCNANFWIYGHSHFNQKPLQLGNTMLLTNQLGYVQNNEHLNFKHNAFISI